MGLILGFLSDGSVPLSSEIFTSGGFVLLGFRVLVVLNLDLISVVLNLDLISEIPHPALSC